MATQRRRNGGQARKHKPRKGAANGRGLPGWLWGLGGLTIGLFVALIVNLELNTDSEDLDRILDSNRSEQASESAGDETADETSDQPDQGNGQTAEGDDEPEFEFYRVLPDQEVEVPREDDAGEDTAASEAGAKEPTDDSVEPAGDKSTESAEPSSPTAANQPDQAGPFVLQAGSFKALSAADRMKAELALLGVEAEIKSADLEGGETWHRVRAGPYTDRQRVNEIRQRLRDNDIDTIILGGEE